MSGGGHTTYDLTIDLGGGDIPDPSRVVAGRYVTDTALGVGGFGSVWKARDLVRDVDVAIKIISASRPQDLEQVRRELTALRWVHLPGVARMRDEGIDADRWFIVMDLVDGLPFPGAVDVQTWRDLEPAARSLLEVLARVHAAGIVHRDLKPANVLVDHDHRATIVDFGIAAGRSALAPPVERFVGTPRYASPEQCAGEATGSRSDLYSVGVMLYEALTGSVPHESANRRDLLHQRRTRPARPIASLVPTLEPHVATTIDALVQRRARDRPASAIAALAALRGPGWTASSDLPPVDDRQIFKWSALKSLFHGPDRFLHLQTDAARELWRRTGGLGRRVNRELHAWERAGLVHRDGERFRIKRRALDQLAAGLRVNPAPIPPCDDALEQSILDHVRVAFPTARAGWVLNRTGFPRAAAERRAADLMRTGQLWSVGGAWFAGAEMGPVPHWTAARRQAALAELARSMPDARLGAVVPLLMVGGAAAPVVERATAVARQLLADGDHQQATSLIRLALAHATDQTPSEAIDELLMLRACAANAAGTVTSCNEALYLIDRYRSGSDPTDDLQRLVRATRAMLNGELDRADSRLQGEPGHDAAPFQLAWHRLKAQIARLRGTEESERVLAGMEPWTQGSMANRAAWLGWMGILRYRQGAFEDAAGLCANAAQAKSSPAQRLGNQIDAAAALLEAHQLERARSIAEKTRIHARNLRRPRIEAVATFITRTAAYRAGEPLRPRPELVDAAAEVAPYTGCITAMTEAAIAWRSGRNRVARDLARRGRALATRSGFGEIADLMAGVAAASGAAADTEQLLQRAASHTAPNTGVQVLGLLALGGHPVPPEQLDPLARRVPPDRWSHRLDILSVDECVKAIQTAAM